MNVSEAVHQRHHYSSIGLTIVPGAKPPPGRIAGKAGDARAHTKITDQHSRISIPTTKIAFIENANGAIRTFEVPSVTGPSSKLAIAVGTAICELKAVGMIV
jgi:hypothetical protein